MREPLVSIITPVYNSEKYLEETILSVINQSYINWELLLIDDCSTDNSYEIIQKYLKVDERIKYLKNNKNSGPAITRNKGIENSKGEYIAFLDSDDLWEKDKLKNQIGFMLENKVNICHGDYYFIDENSNLIKKVITDKKLNYLKLLKENQIKTSFLLINKKKIKKIYFPNIKHEDFACFLKFLKDYNEYSIKCNKLLGRYRIQNNSISSNKLKSALWTWNIYREYEKLNLLKSMYYFINYIYRGIRKYK